MYMIYQLIIGNKEILRYGILLCGTVIHKITICYDISSRIFY